MSATVPEAIKIYLGTEPRMWRGEAVLRFSIDQHASRPVEVVSMDRSRADPNWEGWNMGRPIGQPATQDTTPAGEAVWFTDFTNFRWAIPQVCGFAGKAIYLDVDEVLLDDPAALFDLPIPRGYGALSLSPGETSVMLFDCGYFENLAGWPSVDEMKVNGWGIERYLILLKERNALAPLPPRWNCLDGRGFDEGKTALLHYTDIITQIWRPYPERLSYRRHPVAAAEDIWVNLYREAQDKGYIPPSPPPEGTLPSGVDDSFLSFLDEQLSNLVLRQLNQAAA